MNTAITRLLGIDAPLVGFSRSPGVVTAVSRAGGLGVLAASHYTPDQLDRVLSAIDTELEDRPYGIDVVIPAKTVADPGALLEQLRAQIPPEHQRFVADVLARHAVPDLTVGADHSTEVIDELMAALTGGDAVEAILDVVFGHRPALVANALGPAPPSLIRRARAAGVPVAGLVGDPRHAVRQLEAGVDVLVAQGTEAGGHTGTIATMVLTPEVVAVAGDRPVLAAGGIASGPQMAAALALGAAGVWCGSVWLVSDEDVTPDAVKRKLLAARAGDTLRSRTRTGKPARQLRSGWHDAWDAPGSPEPLPMPLQPMLVHEAWERIDVAAEAGHDGALELESWFVGQAVGSMHELQPAEAIARQMVAGCERRLAELAHLVTGATA